MVITTSLYPSQAREATPPLPAREEMARAVRLLYEPGNLVELRIPKTAYGTLAGYYLNHDLLVEHAAEWSGKAPAVYVSLNPIRPDLLALSPNHLSRSRRTTRDQDILCRRWLPIDFDAKRPKGVSSTEEEHKRAIAAAYACREWLRFFDWPRGILADSGNGAHLLLRLDLPNDDASKQLVKDVLMAVREAFEDEYVSIDLTCRNSSRVWKLYGSACCKGENTPDRAHRLARLLEVPDER